MNDEKVLIWINEDCLHPNSPALRLHPNAPRVFVFDETISDVSLKRIAFQYECLLEIPNIEIRKGAMVEQLIEAVREHECARIVTTSSVAPNVARVIDRLQKSHKLFVTIIATEPFLELTANEIERLDLKRFSRFWNVVKRRVLSLNQSFDW